MRRLCLAALALSFAVACDVEPDQVPQALAHTDTLYTAPDGYRYENVEIDLSDGPSDVIDDPCECTSDACVQQWADANLGCATCVTLVCPGAIHHACTTCTPPETYPHATESKQ